MLINYTLNIQIKQHSPKLNVVTPCGVINKPFSVGDNIFIMENQEEIWKDVVGYEGLYKVSNKATVKRVEGSVFSEKRNLFVLIHEKIMNPAINKQGYYRIKLTAKNKSSK